MLTHAHTLLSDWQVTCLGTVTEVIMSDVSLLSRKYILSRTADSPFTFSLSLIDESSSNAGEVCCCCSSRDAEADSSGDTWVSFNRVSLQFLFSTYTSDRSAP